MSASRVVWFCIFIALFLALVSVIGRISSPTGMMIANRPPIWDYPTTELAVGPGERIWLDLHEAFFDPDRDGLEFSATPSAGIKLLLGESELTIIPSNSGEVWIEASDGKTKTIQKIAVIVQT